MPFCSFYYFTRGGTILKILFCIILTMVILSKTTPLYAADLPIDINAIGRQDNTNSRITLRFNTHLFTPDAQRVNEALAEQINRRQQTANDLFSTVSFDYSVNVYAQIAYTAGSMGLFVTPADFRHINTPTSQEPLSNWIIVAVLVACAIGGFIWALIAKAKNTTGREDDVY